MPQQDNFHVDTLSDFLQAADTHYHIFDLGRLVRVIPNQTFAAIEAGQMPYPTPLQQHAWLGIVFWRRQDTQASNPYIWFAKFPVDERGLLSHAARQHFLQIIVEALGRDLTAQTTPEQEALLKQNPYLFTPSDDKRAAFHAQVSQRLGQAPSIYFDDVQSFLLAQQSPEQWQQLGVQGLHDVAQRLAQQPKVADAIAQHWQAWPQAFKPAMAAALEHGELPTSLRANLCAQCVAACRQPQPDLANIILLIRALAGSLNSEPESKAWQPLRQALTQLCRALASDPSSATAQTHIDLLVVIAARAWPLLTDDTLRNEYLHAVSHHTDLFAHIFADLVALPVLRIYLLQLLSQPQHLPTQVQTALQFMQQRLRGQHVRSS